MALLLPLSVFVAGCRSDCKLQRPGLSGSADPVREEDGRIAIGDSLTILFADPPNWIRRLAFQVGADGTVALPFNIHIRALGKTPTELEREIRDAYVPSLFPHCTPTVRVNDRVIYVGGKVKVTSRQLYSNESMTDRQAIITAGGVSDFANVNSIEVWRPIGIGRHEEYLNYYKAIPNPTLDLLVFPGDKIIVPRRIRAVPNSRF